MTSLKSLEKEIKIIKQRNKKVEADKAWETSFVRKIINAVLTYLTIVVFFFFAELSKPLINAIVPSLAFIISTSSIPFFKKIWLKFN